MKTVSIGDRDNRIIESLQTDLTRLGYLTAVDGNFGTQTLKNLKAFQRDHSLLPDGVCGNITWGVINQKMDEISGFVKAATPVSNGPTPWMDWLETNRGQKEIPGDEANQFIVDLFKYTTLANTRAATSDETAWCAACACAALAKNGFTSPDSALAEDFDNYGTPSELKYGAIVTFRWSNGERHVSFYCGEDAWGRLKCLGGNQGNALKYSSFSKNDVKAVRWPIKATADNPTGTAQT